MIVGLSFGGGGLVATQRRDTGLFPAGATHRGHKSLVPTFG